MGSGAHETHMEVASLGDMFKVQEDSPMNELFPTATGESLKRKLVSYKDICMGINGQKHVLSDDEPMIAEERDSGGDENAQGKNLEDRGILCLIVQISRDERKLACEPWKKSIIVKLLGRKFGLRYLKDKLQKNVVTQGLYGDHRS